MCNPTSHPLSTSRTPRASRNARGLHCLRESVPLWVLCKRVSLNPESSAPLTKFQIPTPSPPPTPPPLISSINKKRGIHSDIRPVPRFGRQTGAGSRWSSDTDHQPNGHPAMTTSGKEPPPIEPDPGPGHRNSLSPPQTLSQASRATSLAHGSTGSSLTVVHEYFDKLEPAATVKRYERSAKLEGPFIDVDLPPLTTSFDG